MKPYLLMLLLAIPPLISNILACENAEKPDTPPTAEKAYAPAKETTAPVATPAATPAAPAPAAAPTAAKPAPTPANPASVKAWYMM